jgi:DMSO/TMAO reductase YedYZ molybdopterin-dependent catalytic subunit
MTPRGRTGRAFIVLGIFLIGVSGTFAWVQGGLEDSGTTIGPFRSVLDLNGRLWHALYSPVRESHGRPVAPGRKPRVNGDIGLEQAVDAAHWKMEVVADDAAKPFTVTMAELKALPRTASGAEFRCIEGWSEPITYAGVRFSDFAAYFKLDRSVRYVGMRTPDGAYYVSIDMDSMLHPQTVLAYEMNGAPLSDEDGAPLRLIIPVKYGIKNIKRIGRLWLSNTRPADYWAEQGYDWFAGL